MVPHAQEAGCWTAMLSEARRSMERTHAVLFPDGGRIGGDHCRCLEALIHTFFGLGVYVNLIPALCGRF